MSEFDYDAFTQQLKVKLAEDKTTPKASRTLHLEFCGDPFDPFTAVNIRHIRAAVHAYAATTGGCCVNVCARIESELAELDADDKAEMLQSLGSDSALGGAASDLANDDAALDQIFERMQDPAVLEKLQALASDGSFQEKVEKMTQDPKFMSAATQYADDMAKDVAEAVDDSSDVLGLEDLDEEDDEDDAAEEDEA